MYPWCAVLLLSVLPFKSKIQLRTSFISSALLEAFLCPYILWLFSHWLSFVPCAQYCLTVCDPVDHSPPGSSVHGILKAGVGCHFFLQGILLSQDQTHILITTLFPFLKSRVLQKLFWNNFRLREILQSWFRELSGALHAASSKVSILCNHRIFVKTKKFMLV